MKYRKNSIVVEAIQWDGTTESKYELFNWGNRSNFTPMRLKGDKVEIDTLKGTITASIGDFIVKGVNGEFYLCKPSIFKETHEEVL